MLIAGLLLVLGVLCVAPRIPVADAIAPGLPVAEWSPPAAYPPFAAILFAPAAWLPTGVLKAVLVLGSAGLFAPADPCCSAGCRACGPGRTPSWPPPSPGCGWSRCSRPRCPARSPWPCPWPVLWDLHRPRGALGKGFALGTAAGITLTPALLIPRLLLTDRIRAGLTALGTFAGTGLLGLLVVPGASAEFWSRHSPAGGRSLLLAWPHLWVRTVSLLTALLAAALRLRRRAAGAQAAAESTGEEPVGEQAAGVPRDGQPSASSSSASMIR